MQGEVVHLLVVAAHEHRHLVDKRSRAAGAVAVHAQLRALAVEEHDLGVLAANVYQCLCLWETIAGENGRGNDLLHEFGV